MTSQVLRLQSQNLIKAVAHLPKKIVNLPPEDHGVRSERPAGAQSDACLLPSCLDAEEWSSLNPGVQVEPR